MSHPRSPWSTSAPPCVRVRADSVEQDRLLRAHGEFGLLDRFPRLVPVGATRVPPGPLLPA